MVFQIIGYLFQTVSTELLEDIAIVKDIVVYHCKGVIEKNQIRKKKNELRRKMDQATTYQEWKHFAQQIDTIKDIRIWKDRVISQDYDYQYILHLRDTLRNARNQHELSIILHVLRSHSFRNIANILNPDLHNKCFIGTKTLIEDFHFEIQQCLKLVAETDQLSYSKKKEFFVEMRHALGRTALVLSGGAILGLYHIGLIKCLYEENLLPKIIAGSSSGSIIAAFVATRKWEEIQQVFDLGFVKFDAFKKRDPRNQVWRKIKRFFSTGVLMDIQILYEFMRDNLGDITFQDAYDQTGFILNVIVSSSGQNQENDHILNYLTAPNVLIWSAVCCSCAMPLLYGPADLLCKNEKGDIVEYMPMGTKFIDGSFSSDAPVRKLSEFFNVNSFIVSMTNPFTIPFQDRSRYIRYSNRFFLKSLRLIEKLKDLLISEVSHRINQLVWIRILPRSSKKFLTFITNNFKGNINIFPVPSLLGCIQILQNPNSKEQLSQFSIEGAKAIFNKISEIDFFTFFERTLDQYYKQVKQQIEQIAPQVNQGEGEDVKEDDNDNNIVLESGDQQNPQRKVDKIGNVLNQNKTDMRNYSFVIPRSQSKEVLDQLSELGVKQKTKKATK